MSAIYNNPNLYNIQTINELIINSDDMNKIVDGILGLSLYGENRYEIQKFIINLLINTHNVQIKKTCITALSHIVRVDGYIINSGIDIINKLKNDELYSNSISDLLDDIEIFIKKVSQRSLCNRHKM